jgi:pilus assembly protein CpaB
LFNIGGPTPPIVRAAPKIETDEVLVAAQDVPMGTQIGDTSVTWQVWPKAAISELMIAKSAGPSIMADIKSARWLMIQS